MALRRPLRTWLAHLVLVLLPLAALFCYALRIPELGEMRVDRFELVSMADAMSRVAIGVGIRPCDTLGFVSDLEGVQYEAAMTVAKFALAPAVVLPGATNEGKRHELVLAYLVEGGIPIAVAGEEWLLVNETPSKRGEGERACLWRHRP